jgi:hypothetical protein
MEMAEWALACGDEQWQPISRQNGKETTCHYKSLTFVIFSTKDICIQGGCRHKTLVNGTQYKRRQKLITCLKKNSF